LSIGIQCLVFFTCIGGLILSVTYAQVFSLVSPTTVTVASTSNKAVAILFATYFFGTVLSVKQMVGLLICLGGGLWFAVESRKPVGENKIFSFCSAHKGRDVGV
jgi:drug/metabolite transporter (DMT)-like permease